MSAIPAHATAITATVFLLLRGVHSLRNHVGVRFGVRKIFESLTLGAQ